MADFTAVLSGTVEVNNSDITEEIKSEFIIAYNQANVMDQFVEYDRDIDAKSIGFPRFALTAPATTPLNEREDVTSIAMADSEILLTPQEYGMAITPTRLVDLQTGGRALRAAVQLAGTNMAESTNIIATQALEASTNVMYGGSAANEGALAAGDTMDAALLGKIYNKMSRANVPVCPVSGTYIATMHDDVIHDLREGTAAGTWQDVNKYNNEIPVLNNEIGMYKGFRILRNNHQALNVDGGATTVDSYASSFLGYNGLGKAESAMPALTLTGPFDKLGRFINIGWYGVFSYNIIESEAVWKTLTSSSVGVNV